MIQTLNSKAMCVHSGELNYFNIFLQCTYIECFVSSSHTTFFLFIVEAPIFRRQPKQCSPSMALYLLLAMNSACRRVHQSSQSRKQLGSHSVNSSCLAQRYESRASLSLTSSQPTCRPSCMVLAFQSSLPFSAPLKCISEPAF